MITGDTGVEITALNAFTYSVVTSIAPSSGQGGTKVTISGNNLLADDRSVTKVTLNGIEAIVDSSNASTIIVETAALAIGADQTGTVEITLDNGQTIESVALEDGSFVKEFTYKVAGAITNVFPVQGQANTQVTITGTTLLGQGASSASVTLAGVVATVVTENNSVVVVDAGVSAATAAGAVVITADTGAVVSVASTFGYVAVGNITSVSPASGQLSTKVTIGGSDLLGGGTELAGVTLAGVAVQSITSDSSTEVIVVAAASNSAVTGDIVLSSENGASVTSVNGFEYLAPTAITSVLPVEGQSGTSVTIQGTELFSGGASVSVTLGGVAALVVSQNNTYIVVAAGTTVTAGLGDVVLTANTGAVATGSNLFTLLVEGSIAAVTPNNGQADTVVAITGSNLLGGGSTIGVTLSGNTVTSVTFSNDTLVSVVAASGTAGAGDVVITAETGATVALTNGWTQLADGAIAAANPNEGQDGTRVEITGARLLGGGSDLVSVTLAGVAATYVAGSANSTHVNVVVNAGGVAGVAGDIVLVADSGAVVTSTNGFTYLTAGDVTSVTPDNGQGGATVAINGTNLLGGGASIVSVTLANVAVSSITSSTDDSVVVEVGPSVSAGAGDIVLTSSTGAIITETDGFAYVADPNITAVAPASGQLGTVCDHHRDHAARRREQCCVGDAWLVCCCVDRIGEQHRDCCDGCGRCSCGWCRCCCDC